MLIVCIGPDLYRAIDKARELEAAFRQKYDIDGSSIEQLHEEGTELVDAVVQRVNTVSLFTPRRFVRVRNLLNGCPKGRVGALEKALSVDPEHVIVVSVEENLPPDATLKTLAALPKYVRYDFSRLEPRGFETWVREQAVKLGCLISVKQVAHVAEMSYGDSWQAALRIIELAAGGDASGFPVSHSAGQSGERNLFDWADAYLKQDPMWRQGVERVGADTLLHPFLSQLRTFQRVQDGEDAGIPPFVARKLRGIPSMDVEERFLRLTESILLQRQGFLREEELAVLF